MAPRKSSAEYDPSERSRPAPAGLEHKSTADTLIGYNISPVPEAARSGESVTAAERAASLVHPGTPAAGNGVQNSEAGDEGTGNGLTTGSGGTQRTTAAKSTAK